MEEEYFSELYFVDEPNAWVMATNTSLERRKRMLHLLLDEKDNATIQAIAEDNEKWRMMIFQQPKEKALEAFASTEEPVVEPFK